MKSDIARFDPLYFFIILFDLDIGYTSRKVSRRKAVNLLPNYLLENILKKLSVDKTFLLKGEADVRQGIVLPILACLGWDRDNVEEVVPEFTSGGGKVDYCLFCNNKESVLIEVKRAGEELRKHQQQLLEYAFKLGVNLAVLTNGFEWWLYLPLEEGRWEERRFMDINIREQSFEIILDQFKTFLNKKNVEDGSAVKKARELRNKNKIQILIDATIPEAWNALLEEQDEILLDLLAEKVREICSYRPDGKQIKDFVSSLYRQNTEPYNREEDVSVTSTRVKIPKDKNKIKIRNLIDAGIIKPSTVIYNTYKGIKYEARILENGEIRVLNNKTATFKSLSKAAFHITGNSINGWVWWKCQDEKGREVPLDAFREKLKKKPDLEGKQECSDNSDVHDRKGYQDEIRNITSQFLKANDTNKREMMSFTHLDEASIGEREKVFKIPRDDFDLRWFSLRKMAAESAIRAGKRDELLTMAGYEDLNSNKNWRICNDLGLKIHQYGAGETCKSFLAVAEMLKSKIEIKFHWQNNKEAKYPGERGLISYDFSKEGNS